MSEDHYLPGELLFAISCRIVSPRLLSWVADSGGILGEESDGEMVNVSRQSIAVKQERKIIDDYR